MTLLEQEVFMITVNFFSRMSNINMIKVTVCSFLDWSSLLCLVQLLTWFHGKTTVIFGAPKDGLKINSVASNIIIVLIQTIKTMVLNWTLGS